MNNLSAEEAARRFINGRVRVRAKRNVAIYPSDRRAFLITAAPDMLAALKASVALADRNFPQTGWRRTKEAQAIYEQCHAAIAKAEGRSP